MNERFDVIIIGTGAGGGTLLHRPAPTLRAVAGFRGRHGFRRALAFDDYCAENVRTVVLLKVCPGLRIVDGKLVWLTESG